MFIEELEKKQGRLFKQLKTSVTNGRLSHAYLFEGEEGTGKETMALWLSQSLLCLEPDAQNLACGHCINCQRISQHEHPDVTEIKAEGQTIKVDQIRQLKKTLMTSSLEKSGKVLIVYEAEKMTISAANSLLKQIEEPEGKITIFFLTTAKARILATIQSRCQNIHFRPLSPYLLEEKLVNKGVSQSMANELVQLTHSYDKALELSQDEWFNKARETNDKWFNYLVKEDEFAFVYVQQMLVKVFKEREQQIILFQLLLAKYRQQLVVNKKTSQISAQAMELVLLAERKLKANVSFQNVCEQLSLQLVRN